MSLEAILEKKFRKIVSVFFLMCKCLGLLHAKNGAFACICTSYIHVLLGLHCTGIFYGTGLTLTQINKEKISYFFGSAIKIDFISIFDSWFKEMWYFHFYLFESMSVLYHRICLCNVSQIKHEYVMCKCRQKHHFCMKQPKAFTHQKKIRDNLSHFFSKMAANDTE